MTRPDRRSFLRTAILTGGVVAAAGPFQGVLAHANATPGTSRGPQKLGYGALAPVADERDGVVRMHLPEGFRYRSFEPTGATLGDGTTVPGRHDGMAAFRAGKGRTALVRNHEVNGPVGAFGDSAHAYDPAAGGGTTTVIVDRFGNVADSYVSLNGTQMNCAGGATPWGSWLSCEETVNGPDVGNDFTGQDNSLLTQKHGYVFEVPAEGRSAAVPIRSAGRFAHEAAVYVQSAKALYLTEDNFAFPSGFYRYTPPNNPMRTRSIEDGGTLEMLKVVGEDNADLAGQDGPAPAVGSAYRVEWVTIDEPDPDVTGLTNNQAIVAVGDQGRAKGAAIFARLEGAVADGPIVYFVSTQGGSPVASDPSGFGRGRGQVWAYDTRADTLELLVESPGPETLDLPDNVTVSKRGTLVLCEDGKDGNLLRGLTTDGELFDFARNEIAGRTDDEFAGATFSPDGHTLFVNIQASSGLTFAIWGPWNRGAF